MRRRRLERSRPFPARAAALHLAVLSSLAWVPLTASALELPELPELPPLPERPAALEPVERQCSSSVALVPGEPVPAELVDADGLVVCSAVAVPTSEALDLVAFEAWADALEDRYRLDTMALRRDVGWYAGRLAELEDVPWYRSPAAARWGGRLEVLATVAALAGTFAAADRAAR